MSDGDEADKDVTGSKAGFWDWAKALAPWAVPWRSPAEPASTPRPILSTDIIAKPALARALDAYFDLDAAALIAEYRAGGSLYAICHACRGTAHPKDEPVKVYASRHFKAALAELLHAPESTQIDRWVGLLMAKCGRCNRTTPNWGEERLEREPGDFERDDMDRDWEAES